jgi:hypothetical protein
MVAGLHLSFHACSESSTRRVDEFSGLEDAGDRKLVLGRP